MSKNFEIMNTVSSNSIFVVSHVSLLAVKQTLPFVTEVVPFCAPSSGLTRVVILGNNFIESPTTRVKFDNIEVIPFFHGPKTLICHVPQHKSGSILVTVCNTPNAWSTTSARFTYLEVNEQKISNPFFNISNIKIEGEEMHSTLLKKELNSSIAKAPFDDLESAFFSTSELNGFDQVGVSGFY